jgi:hypothetical protein
MDDLLWGKREKNDLIDAGSRSVDHVESSPRAAALSIGKK